MAARVASQPSLYLQIGGHEAIAAVVDVFYHSVLADTELASFFAHSDLERLRRHQAAFLGVVIGGPNGYRGQPLRRAHAGMGITAHHFELIVGHLVAALDACDVPDALITEVTARVVALQGEVVGA